MFSWGTENIYRQAVSIVCVIPFHVWGYSTFCSSQLALKYWPIWYFTANIKHNLLLRGSLETLLKTKCFGEVVTFFGTTEHLKWYITLLNLCSIKVTGVNNGTRLSSLWVKNASVLVYLLRSLYNVQCRIFLSISVYQILRNGKH